MAVAQNVSLTMQIRDLANLVNVPVASLAGAGNVTVSTVYDGDSVRSGAGSVNDTIKLVAFGGTSVTAPTAGHVFPGLFGGFHKDAITLTTGAAVGAANDITFSLVTPYRTHENAVRFLDVVRRTLAPLDSPFVASGSSPANRVSYTV